MSIENFAPWTGRDITPSPASERASKQPAPNTSALIVNGSALAAAAAEIVGFEVVSCGIDQLSFSIDSAEIRINETVSGRDLADFGLVQMVSYPRPTASVITAISDYLRHRGIGAINVRGIGAPTKLSH